MQAPNFHNTAASTARNSSELPIGDKQDSSSRYDYVDLSKDSKDDDRSSSLKQDADDSVDTIDFVRHEDFPKLYALTLNLDRWEYSILQCTKRHWCTLRGDGTPLDMKNIIRHLQASLEVHQENVAHFPVLRRGVDPLVDTQIDRASKVLCQECSDIFYFMGRCLFAKEAIEEQPQRMEKDLDVMCRSLSPFEQWSSECYDIFIEFSKFWLSTDDGSDICESLSENHDVEEHNDLAELPAADESDLIEFNTDNSADEFFWDDDIEEESDTYARLSEYHDVEEQYDHAELPPAEVSDLIEFNTDNSTHEFFSDELELSFDKNWDQ